MIPAIGVMVGAYIITRMLELIFRPKERTAGTAAIVFAAITILVSLAVIADLVMRGTDVSNQLPGLGR